MNACENNSIDSDAGVRPSDVCNQFLDDNKLSTNIDVVLDDGVIVEPVVSRGGVDGSGSQDEMPEALNNDPELVGDALVGQEAETRQAQGQAVPYTPSAAEIKLHRLTHLPYRSWCPSCVKGKGRAPPHRSLDSHTHAGVPVISIDYAFICDTEKESDDLAEIEEGPDSDTVIRKLRPMLVIFDARTKGVYAHSVPRKGLNAGACKLIVDDLNRLGYKKIVLKSDAEPALVVFNEALTRAWPGEVIPEHSRKGDSQSNGEVERTIQTLTSQVRAMKIAHSENIGADILDDAPVVS